MEVKIGVQNVSREITFETDSSAEEVVAAVSAAVEQGTALTLTGEKGRKLLVPAGVLGYVQLGETEKRGVGFGNI
jgi:ABC-type microcin C transport system duplicated ATPase subunit YejF